jgi:ABC-2 type transport system permease protein
MLYRILNLTYKEFLQVSRDWMLALVLVVAPVLQLSLLASNTGSSVKNLPLVVLDLDHSRTSREIATALDNMTELRLVRYASSLQDVYQLLDMGQADVAVILPNNLGRDLAGGTQTAQIQIIVSGTNNVAGSTGLAAAQGAVSRYLASRLMPAGATAASLSFRTDVRYNPTLNSRNYSIPAMIGTIVFELVLTIAAQALTRERETGTLEQLIIMPFQRIELIIGKAIPPLVITLADFGAMLWVAVNVFHVPMRGSLPLLLGLTSLFMVAEVNWGMLISTLARTQQQAILFVFVEAIFDMTFSGFLVSVDNLPPLLKGISAVIPLRYYLVIIRSVMLKGAGLDVLWPQAAALAGLAIAIGTIAILNVGRRLD